jgi:hypothetical protein
MGPVLPGSPCNDGNPLTVNDVITADCDCVGTDNTADCLGVPYGGAVPGTACTFNSDGVDHTGIWSVDCVCDTASTGTGGCQAMFWPIQASEGDSLAPNPVPNVVWIWSFSSGNGLQYQWDFGDGSSSTEVYPTHEYDGPGPYQLCLTIWDDDGCTDAYCDSISLDDDGFLNGLAAEGHDQPHSLRTNGFTVNVVPHLTMDLPELSAFTGLHLWPNPAGDALNLSLVSHYGQPLPLAILDRDGRILWQGMTDTPAAGHPTRICLDSLDRGMYLLRIGDRGNAVTRKFIKM